MRPIFSYISFVVIFLSLFACQKKTQQTSSESAYKGQFARKGLAKKHKSLKPPPHLIQVSASNESEYLRNMIIEDDPQTLYRVPAGMKFNFNHDIFDSFELHNNELEFEIRDMDRMEIPIVIKSHVRLSHKTNWFDSYWHNGLWVACLNDCLKAHKNEHYYKINVLMDGASREQPLRSFKIIRDPNNQRVPTITVYHDYSKLKENNLTHKDKVLQSVANYFEKNPNMSYLSVQKINLFTAQSGQTWLQTLLSQKEYHLDPSTPKCFKDTIGRPKILRKQACFMKNGANIEIAKQSLNPIRRSINLNEASHHLSRAKTEFKLIEVFADTNVKLEKGLYFITNDHDFKNIQLNKQKERQEFGQKNYDLVSVHDVLEARCVLRDTSSSATEPIYPEDHACLHKLGANTEVYRFIGPVKDRWQTYPLKYRNELEREWTDFINNDLAALKQNKVSRVQNRFYFENVCYQKLNARAWNDLNESQFSHIGKYLSTQCVLNFERLKHLSEGNLHKDTKGQKIFKQAQHYTFAIGAFVALWFMPELDLDLFSSIIAKSSLNLTKNLGNLIFGFAMPITFINKEVQKLKSGGCLDLECRNRAIGNIVLNSLFLGLVSSDSVTSLGLPRLSQFLEEKEGINILEEEEFHKYTRQYQEELNDFFSHYELNNDKAIQEELTQSMMTFDEEYNTEVQLSCNGLNLTSAHACSPEAKIKTKVQSVLNILKKEDLETLGQSITQGSNHRSSIALRRSSSMADKMLNSQMKNLETLSDIEKLFEGASTLGGMTKAEYILRYSIISPSTESSLDNLLNVIKALKEQLIKNEGQKSLFSYRRHKLSKAIKKLEKLKNLYQKEIRDNADLMNRYENMLNNYH